MEARRSFASNILLPNTFQNFGLFHRVSQHFRTFATISKHSQSNFQHFENISNRKHQTWKAKKEIITVWVVKKFYDCNLNIGDLTLLRAVLVGRIFMISWFSWLPSHPFHDSLKFRIFWGFDVKVLWFD